MKHSRWYAYWNQIGDCSFQIHYITYSFWIHDVTLCINSKWIHQNPEVLYLQGASITADLDNVLVFKFYENGKTYYHLFNPIIWSNQSRENITSVREFVCVCFIFNMALFRNHHQVSDKIIEYLNVL